jgi:hypothetical protein
MLRAEFGREILLPLSSLEPVATLASRRTSPGELRRSPGIPRDAPR